mmetsp:Transcript_31430/g.48047  ORF Transcript_31430/g.48047 Transcript_31430/m.48047 type:complete len:89 (-) Transcript_31430:38-304(-)
MFCQIFLMVALRSHYSIDMMAGVFIAHYFWMLAERYSYLIDWYVFKIPLQKRMEISERGSVGSYYLTCRHCNHPVSNFMVNEREVVYN